MSTFQEVKIGQRFSFGIEQETWIKTGEMSCRSEYATPNEPDDMPFSVSQKVELKSQSLQSANAARETAISSPRFTKVTYCENCCVVMIPNFEKYCEECAEEILAWLYEQEEMLADEQEEAEYLAAVERKHEDIIYGS